METRSDAAPGELIACHTCGLVQRWPATAGHGAVKCARCRARLHRFNPQSRTRTLAFALSALALYTPANIYPVITMDLMGRHSENTVWSGVVALCQDQMYFIGGIVFLASILIPALKVAGLLFLAFGGHKWPRFAKWTYQIICKAGPWAMLDVFLLAIAVALIRFGQFGHVSPGPGVVWFASVVVFTLLASASFDSRLIWRTQHDEPR